MGQEITDKDIFMIMQGLEEKGLVERVIKNQVPLWQLSPKGENLREELRKIGFDI